MGERLSGDGVPDRRRVHPGGAVSGPVDAQSEAGLEKLLAGVLRQDALDPEAEQQAVAAFRVARDAGTHRARTRRRDDWRMPAERRAGRPVKTTFGVVFASLALGGVAVAAIGSAGSSAHGGGAGRAAEHPSATASQRPGGADPSTPSGSLAPRNRPATAKDTEAHCRAYEHVKDRGKALEATAWQRLVAAAGGEDEVAAYCSAQLARGTAGTGDTGKSGEDASHAGKGTSGSSGSSGNAAGKGEAGGGKGKGKHG
jgi:hypothetical protein